MLACIGRAFLIAFGIAIATALTEALLVFIVSLILGLPFGGISGAAVAIAGIVGFALAVFLLEALLLIFQCIVAGEPPDAVVDNQGGQGLAEGEDSKGTPVTCPICLMFRPYAVAGLLVGFIIVFK